MSDFLRKDQVRDFWNQVREQAAEDQQSGYIGDEWPDAMGHNRFRGEWRRVRRWLDEYAVSRTRCLDVGCGVGLWLAHLAPLFTEAEGIDLSEAMARSTQARMERLQLTNVKVTVASV